MSKLTPPATQHPLRRKRFFLENPDYPNAAEEIEKINHRIKGFRAYTNVSRVHSVNLPQFLTKLRVSKWARFTNFLTGLFKGKNTKSGQHNKFYRPQKTLNSSASIKAVSKHYRSTKGDR